MAGNLLPALTRWYPQAVYCAMAPVMVAVTKRGIENFMLSGQLSCEVPLGCKGYLTSVWMSVDDE